MKRILFVMMVAFLLSACGLNKDDIERQSISDQLDEPIDFSQVKQFDYAVALESIDAETKEVYLPAYDDMYRAVRKYRYHIQYERASIDSEYEFDEQKDNYYSTTVDATYRLAQKRSFFEKGKDYFWHLVKQFGDNSVRINQDGFKGYYSLQGAKLDTRRFYLEKAGYAYRFSPLKRTPEGFEDFDFVQYTIDSLHKADEYDEWEQLKNSLVKDVYLPDLSAYRLDTLSFAAHYQEDKQVGNEVEMTFANDEGRYYFGIYEDGMTLDMSPYASAITLRDVQEKVSSLSLDNGLQVSRHVFNHVLWVKWVIYKWEMDGLHYYLTVKDERIQHVDDLNEYEPEFFKLIESVEKPL